MAGTDPLILVGCGGSKRDTRQPAYSLYDSVYFQKKMAFAMQAGQPAILSAKYGFVWPHERLDPYDESMTDKPAEERHAWALEVEQEIPMNRGHIVVLAGEAYRNHLVPLLETRSSTMVHSPFDYTHGIGEQQQFLTGATDELAQNGSVVLDLLANWRERHG